MEVHGYGLMIALGVLCAGGAGLWLCRRTGASFYDLLILGAYGAGIGMLGAKLLYLLQNLGAIDWPRITDPAYLKAVISGGFVFYGGLIFGVLGGLLAIRLHKLPAKPTVRVLLAVLPLAHGFGRIGCHIAGCCHGMVWHGPLAVTYCDSLSAPNGVPLFPVQLLEAALLFAIAAVLIVRTLRGASMESIALTYLYLYGAGRFCLEFVRGDTIRGVYGPLSTSQWISLALLAAGLIWQLARRKKRETEGEKSDG